MVVCIPVFGALDLFEECLESVVRHTDAPILMRTTALRATACSRSPNITASN